MSNKTPEQNAALFDPRGEDLTLRFGSQQAAYHFKLWLCESGEQDYWDWMAIREEREQGDITAVGFDYHHHSVVTARLGRVSDDEDMDAEEEDDDG